MPGYKPLADRLMAKVSKSGSCWLWTGALLWVGGGFRMPERNTDLSLGDPDNRIHMAAPGPERMNFRSATPMGFSRAVFAANALRESEIV